jgi:hypothetical protein
MSRTIAGFLASRRPKGRVVGAPALKPRGGVAHDVLQLSKLGARLQVEWTARDVHPWDKDLPPERRAELFVEQVLNDTNSAIVRLFHVLPEIDAIEIRVLEPNSGASIIAGSVNRIEAFSASSPSPGMKLKNLGLDYRLNGWRFEPLT